MIVRGPRAWMLAVTALLIGAAPALAAPPETSITSGPEGPSPSKTAKFKFSATVGGATFQCNLDEAAWRKCESPRRYTKLKQGSHTFQVRAKKAGETDASPALRAFTVDTKAPDTSIVKGPTGEVDDPTPEFTFGSTEPGTFECRFGTTAFEPCANPFTPATDLADAAHSLRVRAVDGVGNADSSPATLSFSVERQIHLRLEAAEFAAATYFPDTVDIDVPANCGAELKVDCPGGTPVSAADQLRITSTRSVVEAVGQNRFDLTTTSAVQSLTPIKLDLPLGATCDITFDSSPGEDTWEFLVPLNFVPDGGNYRIVPGDATINGLEAGDVAVGGSFICLGADFGIAFFIDQIRDSLASQLLPHSLCAAPGSAYMEPCPGP